MIDDEYAKETARNYLAVKLQEAEASLITERAGRERAEKCCAEKDVVLEVAHRNWVKGSVWVMDAFALEHALSLDCGRDFVPRSELDECREKNLWCNNEMLKLQKQNTILAGALTRLFLAAQYVCAHRYEDGTAAGTRIVAVSDLKEAAGEAANALAAVKKST